MNRINKYIRPCIILVDPCSTSSVLAKEFDKRGYDCISLISRIKIPEVFASSYQPDDFLFEIRYKNNIEEVLSTLSDVPITVVISCLETSVFLADTIAERLGLPGNNPKTSRLRRDKYQMIEAVRRRGLKAAWQKVFSVTQDAVSWINQKEFPVVIKPLRSAGTDSVFICNSIVQVEEACNTMIKSQK
ncbi:MAG: Dapdiamide A synthase [Candidatus Celerinatantimonas neptuna]|nr:MAG: Dapdiamide A synthase [Candidatus Celerinatantimonas neptuna]